MLRLPQQRSDLTNMAAESALPRQRVQRKLAILGFRGVGACRAGAWRGGCGIWQRSRAAAGKSSLTKRAVGVEFPKTYQPTIISTYAREMEVEGVQFHVDIVDTAGQVRCPPQRGLRGAHARPRHPAGRVHADPQGGRHRRARLRAGVRQQLPRQLRAGAQRGARPGHTRRTPGAPPAQVKNIRDSLLETLGTDSVPMVLVANKADIQPP